mmetsp:Transcript_12332/g.35173  ORF Transcript_12332/g.35173 Transcript_12332/m.35173 type:complete len:698 (-) Transcript_12332:2054-4147(-)
MTSQSAERMQQGRRRKRCYGTSAYSVMKDLLSIGIFISLLVMNYLNISILTVLDGLEVSSNQNDWLLVTKQKQQKEKKPAAEPSERQPKKAVLAAAKEKSKRPARKPVKRNPLRAHLKTNIRKSSQSEFIVEEDDIIYKGYLSSFDSAPIVDEKHKLLFFSTPKVACTTFKFLFRRIMGVEDWDFQDGIDAKNLPHNPKYNNLKYLWDYDRETASKMMTDPEWTRAIFVRDPKMRFLSAFLDKAVANYGSFVTRHCCPEANQCRMETLETEITKAIQNCQEETWDSRKSQLRPVWLEDQPCCKLFKECQAKTMHVEGFLKTIQTCQNDHWEPQNHRMEAKYWKYINFVGHMENINHDTKKLLKRVGAWEEYGKTGWGPHRNESMVRTAGGSQSHKTDSSSKIYQWFNPKNERLVEKFYIDDYENQLFNFQITNLTEPVHQGKILRSTDKIYNRLDWDGAPIVVSEYKLIFFTQPKVGATKWKQAFRRMEGYRDWKDIGGPKGLPHDPKKNGLKYLYDFPLEEAEVMMTSSDWTRAIFVRNPKDRFLSVYNHMRNNWQEIDTRCCPHQPGCSSTLNEMVYFIDLMKNCHSTHWTPYSERIDTKWWKHINFIGRLENVENDAEKLLKSIGAWELVGNSGWGLYGDEPIFIRDVNAFNSVHNALAKYNPIADKMLNHYYKADYENKYLNFPNKKVHVLVQ